MAKKLKLVPLGDIQAFQDAQIADDNRTVGELLRIAPALVAEQPLDEDTLKLPVSRCLIKVLKLPDVGAEVALYTPPGLNGVPAITIPVPPALSATPQDASATSSIPHEPETPVTTEHPTELTEARAVAVAYRDEVRKLASFLRSRLSVLIVCEKLIVPYLWPEILKETWVPAAGGSSVRESRLEAVVLEMPADSGRDNPLSALGGAGPLGALRELIKNLKPDQVLVIPDLDLLGGGDKNLNREARELTQLVYSALDRLVLAFVDPSLPVPEVLAARFAVRAEVQGLPREVSASHGRCVPVGVALVKADEAALFKRFQPAELYKNIAGLNPVRLRQAMAYAVQVARDQGHSTEKRAPIGLLYQEVRAFKAQTSEQFAVPDVRFEDIGGYDEVKQLLARAVELMSGVGSLPDEALRHELVPCGLLFYGPPGTGKTLFAKAIANSLNATIRVVSGPEVTDMYVGESERKVRAIFAEARRNAPSVVVFDEFDSIAARRTGRDDGGGRAGNALVAQILTEMDGFRPDVPMLVIGTTNRLELIDEALLRPSRFQPLAIGLPDLAARRRIAEIHARHFKVPVDDELLNAIANATQGFNGDEIRSLFREACLGMYYENPRIPADAQRLGYLVGLLRTKRDLQRGQGRRMVEGRVRISE
jgi:transitional endoplasmic reticulum ATPase